MKTTTAILTLSSIIACGCIGEFDEYESEVSHQPIARSIPLPVVPGDSDVPILYPRRLPRLPLTEILCSNGFDEDRDGLTDCADPDCYGSSCIEDCGDGEDNDGDTAVDCDDDDCSDEPICFDPSSCVFEPNPDDSIGEDGEQVGMTKALNEWRYWVGVESVLWAPDLAESASAYAEQLVDACLFEHSGSATFGETLLATSASNFWDPAVVVDFWSSERTNYDFVTDTCDPGQVCRDYGQVVWSETTEVGCGAAINSDCTYSQVWVCRFRASGTCQRF